MGIFGLMLSRRILVVFILTVTFKSSIAEVYKDFVPYTSIAQMKANYPNARFDVVKAAWVRENDIFLKITGAGLAGTIYVATSKLSDDSIKQKIESFKAIIAKQPDQDNTYWNNKVASHERYLTLSNDEKYSIDWLRWVPDVSFPLERLKAKFGEPDKYDYSESDFQPFAEWFKRGLRVNLTDDKKMVHSIEYYFTDEDYNKALGIEEAPIAPANEPKSVQKKSKTKAK